MEGHALLFGHLPLRSETRVIDLEGSMTLTRRRMLSWSAAPLVLAARSASAASSDEAYDWRSLSSGGQGFVNGIVGHASVLDAGRAEPDRRCVFRSSRHGT